MKRLLLVGALVLGCGAPAEPLELPCLDAWTADVCRTRKPGSKATEELCAKGRICDDAGTS